MLDIVLGSAKSAESVPAARRRGGCRRKRARLMTRDRTDAADRAAVDTAVWNSDAVVQRFPVDPRQYELATFEVCTNQIALTQRTRSRALSAPSRSTPSA